jgi:prophage antirepressor-like protein
MQLVPTADVTSFSFHGHEVKVVAHGDEYWFLAEDVCQILALANRSQALSRLDDDEKGTIIINDKPVLIVSEPGLYALTMRSRKDETKAFRRWVTHDVLPALRKTGRYEVAQQPLSALDALEQMVTALRLQETRLNALEGGHVQLEQRFDDQPISAHADKRNHIYNLVHELGSALGGTYHVGLTWRRFKAYFNLSKYDALPVKRYPEAVELLTEWIRKAREGDGLFN